ncbi:RNA polymerase sigma factor [Actinokineospora diospyrosa]|uniref:RNA polymerase sigma-70 factor, ECF subfamily n=2 Tax=Actinokineospora diospyrosa TaxID=103728 RepID=A0ABT1IG04_9PSEU|nr:sigma-70 family RNA polymerase sigma factor [Actinokineospora diospyrosa]MCP2271562.1 RNA polymerase sigma-70 factor, ECF subfamily [Actinokineospora diospyrosa]
MTAVAGGDQDALRGLYDRHSGGIFRLLRRLTANAGVAEEILQETWLAVWQSAGSFRGEASARAWLYGVARRQAHNRLRKATPVETDLDEAAELADQAPGVEDRVLAGVEREALATAVAELPEHLREVLVLVLVEDLSYPEVSAALDIPVGTVKSRMSHARRRLAGRLSPSQAPRSTP